MIACCLMLVLYYSGSTAYPHNRIYHQQQILFRIAIHPTFTSHSTNVFKDLKLPYRSLTVRPWKVTFPIGKDSLPTTIFQGRVVKLLGCNTSLDLPSCWVPKELSILCPEKIPFVTYDRNCLEVKQWRWSGVHFHRCQLKWTLVSLACSVLIKFNTPLNNTYIYNA